MLSSIHNLKSQKELAAPARKKRQFTKGFASRQSPVPRWSAFCNEEFEECSPLVGFELVEQTFVPCEPWGLNAVNRLGFVLIDQTSPRSLRVQTEARVRDDLRSRSLEVGKCSVLVCVSCGLSIRFSVPAELHSVHLCQCLCGSVQLAHVRQILCSTLDSLL